MMSFMSSMSLSGAIGSEIDDGDNFLVRGRDAGDLGGMKSDIQGHDGFLRGRWFNSCFLVLLLDGIDSLRVKCRESNRKVLSERNRA